MGYTTEFNNRFELDRPLEDNIYKLLDGLNKTRRMARDMGGYGIEGEFYIKDDNKDIVDFNRPPRTQPGMWCGWRPTKDRKGIEWDGIEKFYHYVEWLEYLIDSVLAPHGYTLNGTVDWQGEDVLDRGMIVVKNNKVSAYEEVGRL